MAELPKVQKEFFYKTPIKLRGRLMFENLIEGKLNNWNKMEYSTVLCVKFDTENEELKRMMSLIKDYQNMPNFVPPGAKFVVPLKKYGVTKRDDGKEHPEIYIGCHWLNLKTTLNPPKFYDSQVRPISALEARPLIYNGAEVIISFKLQGYEHTGKHGVTCYLDMIQVLGKGERVAGSAGVNPNEVFDSFNEQADSLTATSNHGDPTSLDSGDVGDLL